MCCSAVDCLLAIQPDSLSCDMMIKALWLICRYWFYFSRHVMLQQFQGSKFILSPGKLTASLASAVRLPG